MCILSVYMYTSVYSVRGEHMNCMYIYAYHIVYIKFI